MQLLNRYQTRAKSISVRNHLNMKSVGEGLYKLQNVGVKQGLPIACYVNFAVKTV